MILTQVTMVFPEKHFMERLFTPDIAAFYEKFYADKGVAIKPGNTVTAFEGVDGEVSAPSPCCLRRSGSKLRSRPSSGAWW